MTVPAYLALRKTIANAEHIKWILLNFIFSLAVTRTENFSIFLFVY